MATKLFVLGTILLIGIATESSAQYWNRQYSYSNGRYPQQVYPGYQQQRPNYQQSNGWQNAGSFQLPPGVSVADAEWICKSPKTGDMMIIATEDGPAPNTGGNSQGQWQQPSYPKQPSNPQPTLPQVNPSQPTYPQMIIASEDGPVPNRVNGQQQWHQVYPQQPGNNQPNYPQPQQPVYPQPQQPAYPQTQAPPVTNAPTTTTEDTNRPIWGSGGNDNRYPQTQAPVTVKPTTTTTEDTNRPIWGDNNKQPNFPEVKPSFPTSTTQKPVDPLWPEGGSSNKPGFTVIEPTRKPKPHKTTKAPIDDDDDDGPLDIVIG
ncbi:hypothetical protein TSAR_005995 [Trichomalopsis sarcophagae]|uniref:Uncharacterized protein n=1 Tax=Trichomalopsis sarcophagae TaxID=543379 RepID=A0A232F9C0_9HYME|nr:hypothetical protein TSAR_005995 [Trichomalopsis sarcophagae]